MERKKRIITISASVFIVLAVAVISIFLLGDEESVKLKKDVMQIEAGGEMEFRLSDYVEGSKEQLKEVKVDTSDVDVDKPGDYKISITYKDREFLIRVSVKDTTPPVLQVSGEAVAIMIGESVSVDELGIIVDDFSECELTFSGGEKIKVFETAGEIKEEIIAIDAYENKSQTEVSFQVLAVNVPEIYGEGLMDRTFYIEDGVDLLAGIAAQDAEDGDLTAQIQVDAPDLSTPGIKEITYRVTDSDGHETVRNIHLTAENRIAVLDKVMYAAAEAAVRKSASESAQQLGTLQYNEAVGVTGQDKVNGWYRIVYNGEEGYVIGTALGDNQPVTTETQDNVFPNEGSDETVFDGSGSQGVSQYQQAVPTPQSSADYGQFPQRVLTLVNEQRRNNGLAELSWDSQVAAAAQVRAGELQVSFSHTRPDGRDCFSIFADMGISNSASGENIAMGYASPEAVVNGWMNSPGHRANILNPSFTRLGVGYLSGGWVQLFI